MPPKKIDAKQPSLGLGLQEKNPKEAFRNIPKLSSRTICRRDER